MVDISTLYGTSGARPFQGDSGRDNGAATRDTGRDRGASLRGAEGRLRGDSEPGRRQPSDRGAEPAERGAVLGTVEIILSEQVEADVTGGGSTNLVGSLVEPEGERYSTWGWADPGSLLRHLRRQARLLGLEVSL